MGIDYGESSEAYVVQSIYFLTTLLTLPHGGNSKLLYKEVEHTLCTFQPFYCCFVHLAHLYSYLRVKLLIHSA